MLVKLVGRPVLKLVTLMVGLPVLVKLVGRPVLKLVTLMVGLPVLEKLVTLMVELSVLV